MYHSAACGIEDHEEETLVITGGSDSDGDTTARRVTKYKNNGDAEDLPTLNNQRRSHGCGMYRNTNNEKVREVLNRKKLWS